MLLASWLLEPERLKDRVKFMYNAKNVGTNVSEKVDNLVLTVC